jgi:hypothetical protein
MKASPPCFCGEIVRVGIYYGLAHLQGMALKLDLLYLVEGLALSKEFHAE